MSHSALYYYRARHYDPKVGRFLQQDPLPPRWQQMNRYVYVGNNPVNWIDPLGLKAGHNYNYGDYCLASIRDQIRRKGKPSAFNIFCTCMTCCLEAIEKNPCHYAFPDPDLAIAGCVGACEAGLKALLGR